MQPYEYILIALSIGQLLAMIIGGYIFLQKPSREAKKNAIAASNAAENQAITCEFKHARIDEVFSEIKKSVSDINYSFQHFKENEFTHIEDNSKDINVSMAKLDGKMDVLVSLMKDVIDKK